MINRTFEVNHDWDRREGNVIDPEFMENEINED